MEFPRSLDVYRDDNLIIQDFDGIFALPHPLPPLSNDTLVKCIVDAYRNSIKVRLMVLTDITPSLCVVGPIESIEAGMVAMVVASEVEYYKLLRSNPGDGRPGSDSLSIFSLYKDSFDLIQNAGTVILAWRFYGVDDSPFMDRQGKSSIPQGENNDATEIKTLRLELGQARAEGLNNRILKEYMQAKWLATIRDVDDQVSERRTAELIKKCWPEKHVDSKAEEMTNDKDEEATRPFTKYDYDVFVKALFAAVDSIQKDEEKVVKGE
ncbi:hypothetical protein FOXYSP1_15320 [Fusarium oxysporum f. sp. phaseoli]